MDVNPYEAPKVDCSETDTDDGDAFTNRVAFLILVGFLAWVMFAFLA